MRYDVSSSNHVPECNSVIVPSAAPEHSSSPKEETQVISPLGKLLRKLFFSIFISYYSFYPSARWARRGIVFPFVRRRAHTFLATTPTWFNRLNS